MEGPSKGKMIRNWSSTQSICPKEYYEPASVAEVKEIVVDARKRGKVARVVGSAHSPNDCAMSEEVMMSLCKMNKILSIDMERGAGDRKSVV